MGIEINSPMVEKYQKIFDNNQSSRIFAPLAESYRRLGLLDDAFDVLKIGLKNHPDYPMGRLILANCYVDKENDEQAYDILKPFVARSRDNLKLQNLFGDVCYRLDKKVEALDTYKYLLFINPKNTIVADLVEKLEESENNLIKNKLEAVEGSHQLFNISSMNSSPSKQQVDSIPEDWVRIDLTSNNQMDEIEQIVINDDEDNGSSWQIGDIAKVWKKSIESNSQKSIKIDLTNNGVDTKDELDFPMITHTLVDLYCEQGYYVKAKEILEKLIILDPQDRKTVDKIDEINGIISAKNIPEDIPIDANEERNYPLNIDEGRNNLMQCFDEKLNSNYSKKIDVYEKQFNSFLIQLKKRAKYCLSTLQH